MNIPTFIIVIKDILRSRSMAGATLALLLLATLPQPAQAYDNVTSFTPTTTVGSSVPVETLYAVCDPSSGAKSVTVSYSSAFSVLGVSLPNWYYYTNTFYMRWFVVDASATDYTASSVTASTSGWEIQPLASEGNYNQNFNIYGAGENHQYGAVADCKGQLNYSDLDKICGCTYTIPSGTEVSSYKLVCFISYKGTNSSSSYSQTTTDREITAVAEFQLLTSADSLPFTAGSTASIRQANTAEVMTIVDSSTTSATVGAYSEVYNTNTSSFNLGLTSPYYIRWYMEDVATGEVIEDNDTSQHLFATSTFKEYSWSGSDLNASDYYSRRNGFYMTYPQTNFAFTYDNYGTIATGDTILKAALDGMQVTYASGLTNVRVHCLLSTTEPTTTSGYVVAEPDFDAEVIFYFKTKEQIEADYTASDANEDGASEKAITKVLVDTESSTDKTYVVTSDHWSKSGDDITITYDSLAVAADLAVLDNYADKIYYMRWVELDANGDPVTNNSGLFSNLRSNISDYTDNAKYHYNDSTGYHIIYSALSTEHFTVANLESELNKNVTLTNFDATHSIEFVLSTTMPGLTTDNGGETVIFSEPPYDLKITYNYLHADDVATYFYPAASTAPITLTQTQVISSEEELAGNTTINAYTDLSTDLSNVTAKYIRWCVLDDDGNIITSYSGFEASDYSATTCYVNKSEGGTVYTITSAGDDNLTLSDVLNNMSVSVPLVGDTNSGYKVVALIASSTPQTYYDTSAKAYVLNEPAFDVKIEYTLLTASDIEAQYKAALTDASATYTINASVSLSSSISINAFTTVKATYNGWESYSNYITASTYVRWYITDDAGNIIDATNLFNNSVAGSYYRDWGGTYVCSNVSNISADDNYISNLLDNITVSGSTLGKGYQIICLVSTDVGGATTIGGYVSEEPSSYTMKIVYTISNDGTFHHYIGYEFDSLGYSDNESTSDEAYLKVNGGIRQQTNEWTYYRYVAPGDTIQLINRFTKVKTSDGEALEPQGYFRWYDYNTDYASDCLSTNSSFGSKLNLEFYEEGYGYRGLFSYANDESDKATAANYAAVNFTAPADAGWEETIIACDVSKYVDGIVEDTSNPAVVFQHEPTLSMRYKFIVRPNTAIAGYLKDALIDDHVPYEDNKYLTLGLTSAGAGTGQVRTELQRTSDYWFYPCTAPDSAYCDDSYAFTESQFTTTPVQAQAVMWRAYYNDEAYVDLSPVTCSFDNSTFAHQQTLSLSTFPSYNWKDMNGNSTTVPSAVIGSSYELIAFAIDGTNTSNYSSKCPIARYIVRFLSEAPEPFDSLETFRTIDYLEETYTRQAVISFDNYEGSNLSQPETVLVNGNSNAYGIDDMSYSAYGYCYPGLYKYGWRYASGTMTGDSYNMGLSPMHGDYVLLKSMNLSGVSTKGFLTGTDGNSYNYYWHQTSPVVRDRTYLDYSNGAQAGYFLYIDAAEEARPIVSVPFEADLCTGSCLVFSAAVTDMTSATTAPQLMFELFGLDTDDEGNETARHPIHKFNTCDFSTVCKNTKGTWYQVYGKVYLQKAAAVENYSDFLVQITNYANDTQGADYCVDDIRFYTQNAKIEVTQSNAICGESGAILKMKIAYNTLLALIDDLATSSNKHFILYKICNEDGSDYTDITFPVTGTYYSILELNQLVYKTDGNGNYEYDSDSRLALDSSCIAVYNEDGTLKTPGYEYDSDGTLYYVFANNDFNLPAGKTFYISAASDIFEQNVSNTYITYKNGSYTISERADLAALEWGSPSTACSLYSNMFTPAQQSVSVVNADGETVTQVSFDCTNSSNISPTTLSAQIKIPTSSGTFVTYPATSTDGLRIDWIITSAEGYAKLTEEVNGTTLLDSLDTALSAFREDQPNATALSSWTSGSTNTNYTADRYNLLNSYISGTTTPDTASATVYAKVFLTQTYTLATSELDLKVNNTYYLIARAYATGNDADTSLTIDGTAYDLCSDLMMTTLSTTYTGPELAIGFDDVVYPSSRDANIGNVRLGLFHLDDMKNNGAHLHVPVNSISNSTSYSGESKLTANTAITLASTTDPLAESYVGQTVGWIDQTTIGTSDSNNFVDILFKSGADTTPLTFHEGYEYELCVLFADYGKETTESNLCTGNAYITLKVVPEYVTWTGAQGTNTNWNNDDNWTRSTEEELYKTGTGNYTDDSEIFSAVSNYAQPQTYVPLKFTKATIPSGAAQWPYLASVSVDRNTGIAESLTNRDGSTATSLIEYDMVAKVDQGCEHSASGTIYDCEKFYANTCDQIYFKPRTQLLLQHYLTYNYAWVEQQLAPGEWYILGAPLKDTYAGDMYAPANSSFLGKQHTQAFEPITFKYCSYNSTASASDTIYNRSTYPIYQRSWDKSVSKEVTPTGDSRGEYYDAFRESVTASSNTDLSAYSATELQWSHTYNDVTEKYTNGLGYSLRADNKISYSDQQGTYRDSALIRLPKADKEYTYYFYDDYTTTDGGKGTVSKDNYGRFATNATDGGDGSYTTTGLIYATPDALQSGGDYYLLSNPYMSSLYASAFLTRNTMFDSSKIWYVSEGAITGVTVDNSTKLGPMQAFFVKKADGATIDSGTQVTYTLTMTLSSSVSTASAASLLSKQMQMTVESANGKSTVAIVLDDDADSDFFDDEDIETLFDTNLSDRPTLYTVAGSQTVLLNRTDAIGYIPLGVVEDEDEELTLTVSGTENLGTTLYLVDAVDGVSTELTDDAAVTLRSNDHGRYFITSELFSPDGEEEYANAIRCYSPQPGTIVCTSATGDNLQDITVYTSSGMTVTNLQSVDNVSATINVGSRGVYVVRLTTDNAPNGVSVKVVVK